MKSDSLSLLLSIKAWVAHFVSSPGIRYCLIALCFLMYFRASWSMCRWVWNWHLENSDDHHILGRLGGNLGPPKHGFITEYHLRMKCTLDFLGHGFSCYLTRLKPVLWTVVPGFPIFKAAPSELWVGYCRPLLTFVLILVFGIYGCVSQLWFKQGG